jgi:hypothetical protein
MRARGSELTRSAGSPQSARSNESFLWCDFEDPGARDEGPGLIRFGRLKEILSYFVAIFF